MLLSPVAAVSLAASLRPLAPAGETVLSSGRWAARAKSSSSCCPSSSARIRASASRSSSCRGPRRMRSSSPPLPAMPRRISASSEIPGFRNSWRWARIAAARPVRRRFAGGRSRRLFQRHLGHQHRRGRAVWRAVVRRHAAAVLSARFARPGRAMRAARVVAGMDARCWPPSSSAPGPSVTRSCCR